MPDRETQLVEAAKDLRQRSGDIAIHDELALAHTAVEAVVTVRSRSCDSGTGQPGRQYLPSRLVRTESGSGRIVDWNGNDRGGEERYEEQANHVDLAAVARRVAARQASRRDDARCDTCRTAHRGRALGVTERWSRS